VVYQFEAIANCLNPVYAPLEQSGLAAPRNPPLMVADIERRGTDLGQIRNIGNSLPVAAGLPTGTESTVVVIGFE
jgi:hypothetical protein